MSAARGLDGRIYAIGGYAVFEGQRTGTNEAYSPDHDTWTMLASAPTPRSDLGVTLGGDGRIWVIGGYLEGPADLTTVEAYDPSRDSWITAPSLQVPRADVTSTSDHKGRVYAIGGRRPGGVYDSVEVYMPPKPCPRPFVMASADNWPGVDRNRRRLRLCPCHG